MELSLLLAKVIGLLLLIVVGAFWINRKTINLLFNIYSHPEAVFFTGVLETALGILLVLHHNIWTADFRIVITIIGWTLLVRGVGRTLFPFRVIRMLKKFRKAKSAFTPLLFLIGTIGAYLVYMGFAN